MEMNHDVLIAMTFVEFSQFSFDVAFSRAKDLRC